MTHFTRAKTMLGYVVTCSCDSQDSHYNEDDHQGVKSVLLADSSIRGVVFLGAGCAFVLGLAFGALFWAFGAFGPIPVGPLGAPTD